MAEDKTSQGEKPKASADVHVHVHVHPESPGEKETTQEEKTDTNENHKAETAKKSMGSKLYDYQKKKSKTEKPGQMEEYD